MEEKIEVTKEQNEKSIMNSFDTEKKSFFSIKLLLVLFVAIVLGVGTGYLVVIRSGSVSTIASETQEGDSSEIKKGTVVGSNDNKTFKDEVEGVLEEGGIEDEGQFHLVRPGGESQNVYLTSSTIDLSKYLKRKVKIRGQTQKAKVAGWLMDAGRLEVLE